MMDGAHDASGSPFDDDDDDDELDMHAAFDVQETEFAFGPRAKGARGKNGPKKRSNSFKLGSRPREMKDQVRKTYRRNSFHYKGSAVEVVDQNDDDGEVNAQVVTVVQETVKVR